jgi:lipopolysaccharide export system protein LptA
MKIPLRFYALAFLLLLPWVPLGAQVDDANPDAPPPLGATVITSDELHSDQQTHISIFTGNVVVVGTNFKMTCQEMTVNFTRDNKVDTIIATGDVVITQPDRITNCGRAQYYHDDDKFVLTDSPTILDHKNKIVGPEITIYRTSQKMEIKGRSQVTLSNGSLGGAPADSTPLPDSK